MTASEVKQVRQALMDGVARLVGEFDDYPAGVVMRCYSRAVREARLMGHPSHDLPEEVERRTRAMLRARRDPVRSRPPRGPGRRQVRPTRPAFVATPVLR